VENYYSHTGHRWQYNKPHVLCMLDKYGYRHTFIVFYSYCFSTSTMVTRTRLNITLYVNCESCFMYSLQATHTEGNKLNLLKTYYQVTGKKFSEYRKPKGYLLYSKHRHRPFFYTRPSYFTPEDSILRCPCFQIQLMPFSFTFKDNFGDRGVIVRLL